MQKYILAIAAALALYTSCKKDDPIGEPNPPISDTPHISLSQIAPLTIRQFQDTLRFTISYLDGDGDVGFMEADSFALYITDNRFPITEKYHVQPLAPIGTNISIQGKLVVPLRNIILKDQNAVSEPATYTLKLKDRAGHWSNEVTSPVVTIKK